MDILLYIISPLITAVLVGAAGYFLKLPQTFERIRSATDALETAVEENEHALEDFKNQLHYTKKRFAVIDRAITDIADTSFDSWHIAGDYSKYPKSLRRSRFVRVEYPTQ